MITYRQLVEVVQQHTSADTSLNQVSAGLKHASSNLIKPNSTNVDVGGGRYDAGKEHVEKENPTAKLHVFDPFNRSDEHNKEVKHAAEHNADYVGLHNVLNVIKEPEHRMGALQSVKSFMKKGSTAHITVYEGDKTGNGRMSKQDKGRGSSWQEHRPTSSYVPEVRKVFPESTHDVQVKGKHILVTQK